jgi:hypothetical protein
MTFHLPASPPGFYPDPSGSGGQRYFDGNGWTESYIPPPAYQPYPVVIQTGGTNHGLHLLLTILTCGAWLPFWIVIAIFSPKRTITTR